MSKHEAVLALIPILPKLLQVRHIKSYQDKIKGKDNLRLIKFFTTRNELASSSAFEFDDTLKETLLLLILELLPISF